MNDYLTESDVERGIEITSDSEEISNEEVSETEDNVSEIISNGESDTDEGSDFCRENGCSEHIECIAKTGRKYVSDPPRVTKRTIQNILREKQGLRPAGKVMDVRESFETIFTDDILGMILQHTNEEAERTGNSKTDMVELKCFIGVLILIGANNDSKLDLHDLWSHKFGRPSYIAAMSRNRFKELLTIIRFDGKSTRERRRGKDKFAPIRAVFQMINAIFPKYYIPGPNTVVDEMLSLFRGRCPFKVFMKEKPGKYGILIRMLTDCDKRYVFRMEVYAGKIMIRQPAEVPKKS